MSERLARLRALAGSSIVGADLQWLLDERDRLQAAAEAYLNHLGRSVDVGPATTNPRTEAFLLGKLRSAVGEGDQS